MPTPDIAEQGPLYSTFSIRTSLTSCPTLLVNKGQRKPVELESSASLSIQTKTRCGRRRKKNAICSHRQQATGCVALDNLSTLSPWLSDAICRLSTDGGHSARTLYTDLEEISLAVKRPVIRLPVRAAWEIPPGYESRNSGKPFFESCPRLT